MYPVTYEADYEREPNRLTTFFRYVLLIPWFIVAFVYLIAGAFSHLIAWFAVVILGRYPEGLYRFNSGLLRYFIRVVSYGSLITDKYPPFGLDPDPTYPVRVQVAPRPEKQSRLKAFFRAILFLPLYFLYAVGIGTIHSGAAVTSWFTIVFRGYQPAGVHNALIFTSAWFTRAGGYYLLLTDEYPPVGDEGPQLGDVRAGGQAALSGASTTPPPTTPATEQQPLPPEERG